MSEIASSEITCSESRLSEVSGAALSVSETERSAGGIASRAGTTTLRAAEAASRAA